MKRVGRSVWGDERGHRHSHATVLPDGCRQGPSHLLPSRDGRAPSHRLWPDSLIWGRVETGWHRQPRPSCQPQPASPDTLHIAARPRWRQLTRPGGIKVVTRTQPCRSHHPPSTIHHPHHSNAYDDHLRSTSASPRADLPATLWLLCACRRHGYTSDSGIASTLSSPPRRRHPSVSEMHVA